MFAKVLLISLLIGQISLASAEKDPDAASKKHEALNWEIPDDIRLARGLKGLSKKEILETTNQRINFHLGSSKRLEARWVNDTLRIFSKRQFARDEIVFSISHRDALTSEIDISKFSFGNQSEEFLDLQRRAANLRFPIKVESSPFQLPEYVLSLVHAIIYHFANFEHSPLREDLLGVSRSLKVPMFRMHKEEIEILDLDLQKHVYSMRKQLKMSYEFYVSTLNNAFSKQELEAIFPGSDLSFADFLFAADLANKLSASGYNNNQVHIYILPIHLYLGPLDPVSNYKEKSPLGLRTVESPPTGISSYKSDFSLGQEIQSGEELKTWYGGYPNKDYLLRHGYIPETNLNECLPLDLFAQGKYLDFLTYQSGKGCFDEMAIKSVFVVLNLRALSKKARKQCLEAIEELEDAQKTDVLYSACPQVAWKQSDQSQWISMLEKIIEHRNLAKDMASRSERFCEQMDQSKYISSPAIKKFYAARKAFLDKLVSQTETLFDKKKEIEKKRDELNKMREEQEAKKSEL